MQMRKIEIGADLLHRSRCTNKFCDSDINRTKEVTAFLKTFGGICTTAVETAFKDPKGSMHDAIDLICEATGEFGDDFAEVFTGDFAKLTFTTMFKNWAKGQRELVEPLLMREPEMDLASRVMEAIRTGDANIIDMRITERGDEVN